MFSLDDRYRGVFGLRRVVIIHPIPRGCAGACYPGTNPLVPLDIVANGAGAPTSKSIPLLVHPAGEPGR